MTHTVLVTLPAASFVTSTSRGHSNPACPLIKPWLHAPPSVAIPIHKLQRRPLYANQSSEYALATTAPFASTTLPAKHPYVKATEFPQLGSHTDALLPRRSEHVQVGAAYLCLRLQAPQFTCPSRGMPRPEGGQGMHTERVDCDSPDR